MFLRSGRPTREIPLRDMYLLFTEDSEGFGGGMGLEVTMIEQGLLKAIDKIEMQ